MVYVANGIIPILFVFLGVLAKMLSQKKLDRAQFYLGLELMLATFAACTSYTLDQMFRDRQYRAEEATLTANLASSPLSSVDDLRRQKISARMGDIGDNLLYAVLFLVGNIFGVLLVTFFHQQYEGSSDVRASSRLCWCAVGGFAMLFVFLFFIKGINPEPLL